LYYFQRFKVKLSHNLYIATTFSPRILGDFEGSFCNTCLIFIALPVMQWEDRELFAIDLVTLYRDRCTFPWYQGEYVWGAGC